MEKKIRIGIIGLAHLHPRTYMPLFESCSACEAVCACERDADLLEGFCNDFGIAGYADADALLAAERIDMAAIFLPHSDCAEAAVKCARSGVHLMIEKPVSDSSASVAKIIEAAAQCRVLATTGYCWRYHPVIRQLKNEIDEGVLGKIACVEARLAAGRTDRYTAGGAGWMLQKNKAGGGPMYNLGVHWVDLLCYLLSDSVAEVCALNARAAGKYDIEDCSSAILRFRSGALAALNVSYIVPDCFPGGRDLYIGFKGTKGAACYSPRYEGEEGSGALAQVEELEIYSDSEKHEGAAARKFIFRLDKTAGYSGFMGKAYVERFVDAIKRNKQPDITLEEAMKVLKVVEAVYRSNETKSWVEIK